MFKTFKKNTQNNKSTHLFEENFLVSDSGGDSHVNLHLAQLFLISSKTKEPLVKARGKEPSIHPRGGDRTVS